MLNKEEEFRKLCLDVEECTKCSRLKDKAKCLSENNGNLNSDVIFIAQAPGKGAGNTGYPLKGDAVGDSFGVLLYKINLERENVFVTNTILCNAYENGRKHQDIRDDEIRECNEYLKRTIEIVDPKVIVTLGEIALNALKSIENHNYVLKRDVAIKLTWNNKILFPLYLMSQDVVGKIRNMPQQIEDFQKLKKIIDNL